MFEISNSYTYISIKNISMHLSKYFIHISRNTYEKDLFLHINNKGIYCIKFMIMRQYWKYSKFYIFLLQFYIVTQKNFFFANVYTEYDDYSHKKQICSKIIMHKIWIVKTIFLTKFSISKVQANLIRFTQTNSHK